MAPDQNVLIVKRTPKYRKLTNNKGKITKENERHILKVIWLIGSQKKKNLN